jgi:hypothetical protein
VVVAAAILGFALATLPPRPRVVQALAAVDGAHHVARGAYNVHTTISDGTGTAAEVGEAAHRAGLSFVIITDHGDGTRPIRAPVYHAGVLCIDGVEVSTNGGHYAALGMRPSPYPLGGDPRDVVEDVRRLGGFGVATHPGSAKPQLRWREWGSAFDAMEWLNADSQWRDHGLWAIVQSLAHYPFRGPESLAALFDRPTAVLARWDQVTRQRRVVGLAGADAHAGFSFPFDSGGDSRTAKLKLPSYEASFRTFSVQVELKAALTGRAAEDAALVLDGVRAGHVYTVMDALAGPASFGFSATSGNLTVHQGDNLPLAGPVTFEAVANLPPGGSLVLLRNGRPVEQTEGQYLSWTTGARAGTFRVEARLGGSPTRSRPPWIVSNPIYVGGLPEPSEIAVPPQPAIETVPVAERVDAWQQEHDPTSQLSFVPPPDGDPSWFGFRFALGGGGRAGQFAGLSAANLPRLAGYERLAFRGRADRPLRVSVQLRSTEPGGADRRWGRSAYLDEQVRDLTLFLSDFRLVSADGPERPDLSGRLSLLLVLDTIHTLPGTSGRVWIDQLRLER